MSLYIFSSESTKLGIDWYYRYDWYYDNLDDELAEDTHAISRTIWLYIEISWLVTNSEIRLAIFYSKRKEL